MTTPGLARLSYLAFGRGLERIRAPSLDVALLQANVPLRVAPYLALAAAWAVLAGLLAAGAVLLAAQLPPFAGIAAPLPAALVAGGGTVLLSAGIAIAFPHVRAFSRARSIDANLPHALSFVATLGGAGFTAQELFKQLSDQPVYGEVAAEAARITRDMDAMGRSFIEALASASQRSPSAKFKDFCQGAVTSLSSGGQLKDYFVAKSAQYSDENRQRQRSFLEGLGIVGESYVTLLVAAPLFLMVLLSVMVMFGANGGNVLQGSYLLVLVVIPLGQALFVGLVGLMTPEV